MCTWPGSSKAWGLQTDHHASERKSCGQINSLIWGVSAWAKIEVVKAKISTLFSGGGGLVTTDYCFNTYCIRGGTTNILFFGSAILTPQNFGASLFVIALISVTHLFVKKNEMGRVVFARISIN